MHIEIVQYTMNPEENVDVYCKRKKINLGAYQAGIRYELSKWKPGTC
jgi:hypothetical protein